MTLNAIYSASALMIQRTKRERISGRLSSSEILVHPVQHRVPPEPAVPRLEHPVSFVGEVEELAGHATEAKRGECLQSFGDIHPVILLPVHYQDRRYPVCQVVVWRP